MSGLGTWVVDGVYSLRWEEQADGTSGELSLGADTGAELQLTGSPMSLSGLPHTQPSLACVPGGCGEQGILRATLSETWLWPSPSARGARTPSAGTLKVDTSMPHATCSFLPN